MGRTALFINMFAFICLLVAFVKDRRRTFRALRVAFISLLHLLPMVLSIVMLIGLLLTFISKEEISRMVGESSGPSGILITAVLGTVLHIPSLISFPLASSLLERGASVTSVAVFITTLTMIGFVTLPLEIKELGKGMALLRNGISFIIAILIGIIMGAVL